MNLQQRVIELQRRVMNLQKLIITLQQRVMNLQKLIMTLQQRVMNLQRQYIDLQQQYVQLLLLFHNLQRLFRENNLRIIVLRLGFLANLQFHQLSKRQIQRLKPFQAYLQLCILNRNRLSSERLASNELRCVYFRYATDDF
jgi:chromosome segregation ATPase